MAVNCVCAPAGRGPRPDIVCGSSPLDSYRFPSVKVRVPFSVQPPIMYRRFSYGHLDKFSLGHKLRIQTSDRVIPLTLILFTTESDTRDFYQGFRETRYLVLLPPSGTPRRCRPVRPQIRPRALQTTRLEETLILSGRQTS